MLRFNDLRISQKLLLSFGLLVVLAVIIATASFFSLQKIVRTNALAVEMHLLDYSLIKMFDTGKSVLLKDIRNENFLKTGTSEALEEQQNQYKASISAFDNLLKNSLLENINITTQIKSLKQDTINYENQYKQLIALAIQNHGIISDTAFDKNEKNYNLLDDEFDPIRDQVSTLIQITYQNAIRIEIALILITFLIGGFLTWMLTRSIAKPIKKLSDAASQFGKGDLDTNFDVYSKDELGQLAQTFRDLIDTTRSLSSAAVKIGSGSFDVDIHPRSKKDVLVQSLLKMRDSLQKLETENKRELWIKTQIAKITNISQGIRNLQTLLQTVINELCTTLGAGHGLFYLANNFHEPESESEKQLTLFGSYAYVERKNISNRFKVGQGLIGQCALEKKPILLTQVPSDYIQITSGLGEQKPLNILVLPIVHEEQILGVIELGSFHLFNQDEQDLLNVITNNLGIIINNVISHQKTQDLLKESQTLTEELQAQQEELRTTNEELEEKTHILKESEEKLKVQSEELQAANEELEEKTERLTKQNVSIENQNKAIEKTKEDLEQRARDLAMASKYKSEFLANMSHELRTPLNSLLILSKNLQENKENNLTEKQVEAARVIYSGGKELLNLINDILDLSKVEAGHLQLAIDKVSVKQICDGLKAQFEPIGKDKNIAFHVAINPDVPEVIDTDEQRLLQILKNLLSNAFKFTSQGYVTLRASKPDKNIRLKNKSIHLNNAIAFSITDTGIGIPADKQEAIFEAFQQADGSTSRTYGGTGLGLAISKAMAELLEGEIALISEENKGSTFTLYLPIEYRNQKSFRTTAIHKHKKTAPTMITEKNINEISSFLPDDRSILSENSKSLLVIEDDKNFAKIVMDVAKEKGYLTLAAKDGQSGFSLAKTYQPTAIILDLGLPDIDGMDILTQLKFDSITRHIPVHVVSARDETPEVRQKGAIGFLSKPADAESIASVFNKIESVTENEIRHVLLVEDDLNGQHAIQDLITNPHIKIECAQTAQAAKEKIITQLYDCIILDLNLPDKSGFDLLQTLKQEKVKLPPIVVYTGRALTEEEHNTLQQYASSIIVKGVDSPERLLDELSLFLHRIESDLSKNQNKTKQPLDHFDKTFDKRILLVDDDMRNVFALSSILEERGLDVLIASNGKLALEKLEKEKDINLILMDIMMPVMDGYETMRKIRENIHYKNLPIVALTAKAMPEDKEKCLEAGANDYITKPIDTDQLFSMMEVWLSK